MKQLLHLCCLLIIANPIVAAAPVVPPEVVLSAEPVHLRGTKVDKWITDLTFSADGERLAAAQSDGTIQVWDTASRKTIHLLDGVGKKAYAVAFSPDRKLIAAAGESNDILLFDAGSGKVLRTFRGHTAAVCTVAFSHDGNRLASGGYDRHIRIWDVKTGSVVLTLDGHKDTVTSVAFGFDGKTLVSAGVSSEHVDGIVIAVGDKVRFWQLGTRVRLTELPYRATSIRFSRDGKLVVASGSEPDVRRSTSGMTIDGGSLAHILDSRTGIRLRTYKNRGGSAELTLDNRFVVSAPNGQLQFGSGNIIGEKVSRSEYQLCSRMTEVDSGEIAFWLPVQWTAGLALDPKGRWIALPSQKDSGVELWPLSPSPRDVHVEADQVTQRDLEAWWEQLGTEYVDLLEDCPNLIVRKLAYPALWKFVSVPDKSIPFLAKRLQNRAAADERRAAVLVSQLNANRFAVRDAAKRGLADLGLLGDMALRRSLASAPEDAEFREGAAWVAANIWRRRPATEELRAVRGVQILERIGTPAAIDLLKALAKEPAWTLAKQDAQLALERLGRKTKD